MSEKILKGRLVQKHDVEANWELATNFIPKQGEIIVYDIDENYTYERVKIGDGVTNVNDLPFIESSRAEIADHATTADKATEADHAISADKATTADTATKATQDSDGNVITDTYATKTEFENVSTLVGDTAVATQISDAIDAIPQADLAQTDPTAPDYVKNKPTVEDITRMFMEMDVVQPVSDENNVVYTDTDGKLFIL